MLAAKVKGRTDDHRNWSEPAAKYPLSAQLLSVILNEDNATSRGGPLLRYSPAPVASALLHLGVNWNQCTNLRSGSPQSRDDLPAPAN